MAFCSGQSSSLVPCSSTSRAWLLDGAARGTSSRPGRRRQAHLEPLHRARPPRHPDHVHRAARGQPLLHGNASSAGQNTATRSVWLHGHGNQDSWSAPAAALLMIAMLVYSVFLALSSAHGVKQRSSSTAITMGLQKSFFGGGSLINLIPGFAAHGAPPAANGSPADGDDPPATPAGPAGTPDPAR